MREVSDDSSRVPQGILQKNRGIAFSSDLSEHLDDMLDKRIRSRYFYCLGLDKDLIRHDFPKSNSHSNYCKWSGRRRNGADSAALLKRDSGLLDESLTEPSLLVVRPTRERVKRAILAQPSNSNHKIESEKDVSSPCVQAKVSFCPTIQIHEIPSKSMYSDRVRRTIWVAPREAAQQALRRSIIEFMSEGYEVGGVFDESDFVERDGEQVHPVCLLLDEPGNTRLKDLYFGTKANQGSSDKKRGRWRERVQPACIP